MTLTGKGYYIWIVKRCENGDPDRIAAMAREANLTHVIIKVADGAFPYNVDLDNGYDYARHATKKLQAQNIAVWGWQYIYGNYPTQEAEIAVARSLDLGLNGYVVNAEREYKDPAKAPAASQYMNILRSNLGSMPIALSSYRYPSFHAQLPWVNFLDRCDYNMPQIYWMNSHNTAGAQLQRCVNEFKKIHPYRPIIPTGPTFKEHGWVPQEGEVIEFMQVAKKLNLSAVNFWNWDSARKYLPQFWNLVRDYQYDLPNQELSLPDRYIEAMNSKDSKQVLDFYEKDAVHVRIEGAVQGKNAIQPRIASLMKDFTNGNFTLLGEFNHKNTYSFQWEAANKNGNQLEGQDTIGVTDNKINYHYSFIKTGGTQS
jgi:hypothetical protein